MASPCAPLTPEDNDHAPLDQKPASTPTLIAALDPTVLSNDTFVNHDDLDTDIFFDACEVCGDDANAKKVDDHELNGNKVSTPRNSSRFLHFLH
jgi:hypothetical protein